MKKFTKILSVAGLLMCATVGLTACGGEGSGSGTPTPDPIPPTPQAVYTVDEATWNAQLSPANLSSINRYTDVTCFDGDTTTTVVDVNKMFIKNESTLSSETDETYEEKYEEAGVTKIKHYEKKEEGFEYQIYDDEYSIEDFDYNIDLSNYINTFSYEENFFQFSNFTYNEETKAYNLTRATITNNNGTSTTTITNFELSIYFEDGAIKTIIAACDGMLNQKNDDLSVSFSISGMSTTVSIGVGTVTLPENATEVAAF